MGLLRGAHKGSAFVKITGLGDDFRPLDFMSTLRDSSERPPPTMCRDDIRVERDRKRLLSLSAGSGTGFGVILPQILSNNSSINGLFDLLHWHNVLWYILEGFDHRFGAAGAPKASAALRALACAIALKADVRLSQPASTRKWCGDDMQPACSSRTRPRCALPPTCDDE